MTHLLPCPGCSRHVRVSEDDCPFCGSSLDLKARPAPVMPGRRLSRAMLWTFTATVAAGLAGSGCSDGSAGEGSGGIGSGGVAGNTGGDGGFGLTNTGGAYGLPPDAAFGGFGGVSGEAGAAGVAGSAGIYGGPPEEDAGAEEDAATD